MAQVATAAATIAATVMNKSNPMCFRTPGLPLEYLSNIQRARVAAMFVSTLRLQA